MALRRKAPSPRLTLQIGNAPVAVMRTTPQMRHSASEPKVRFRPECLRRKSTRCRHYQHLEPSALGAGARPKPARVIQSFPLPQPGRCTPAASINREGRPSALTLQDGVPSLHHNLEYRQAGILKSEQQWKNAPLHAHASGFQVSAPH